MTERTRLGSWTCPSGNNCEVFFSRQGKGAGGVEFFWDKEPPLEPVDEVYYTAVIMPAVVRLVQEYTERPGSVLYIRR